MTTAEGTIRLVIVDDHAVVREGLRTYLELEDRLQIVGEASNGREAVDKVRAYMPDVVLMDLLMPEMDGIAATRAIKEFAPDVKVIVLTSFQDDEHIMPAPRQQHPRQAQPPGPNAGRALCRAPRPGAGAVTGKESAMLNSAS
jgi:CheY-like chemotaxis protein